MSDQKFLGFHRFKMEDTGEEYGPSTPRRKHTLTHKKLTWRY